MKTISVLLVAMFIAVGCKGKEGGMGKTGDRGPQGTPGLNAPEEVSISGTVTSNDFTVTDSRMKLASSISVYLSDGTKLTESPYYLPALGINTYYLADPFAGTVRIYNAQAAAATNYIIVLFL